MLDPQIAGVSPVSKLLVMAFGFSRLISSKVLPVHGEKILARGRSRRFFAIFRNMEN